MGRVARTILSLMSAIILAITISRWKCDIVYTNTSTICVGALAARLSGRPHIWHIHEFGYEDQGLMFDLGERISRWLMDQLSAVCVVNSRAVANRCKRYLPEQKLKLVYCSINIPVADVADIVPPIDLGGAGQTLMCVIVGSLNENKGQEDAIRAVAELRNAGIDVCLRVIGDAKKADYEKYLHALVVDYGLSGQVTFTGHMDNPFPLISEAAVVLMCSRFEAFGLVTVEAMCLGKPVIGTNSGGTTELIQDGFNGFLYSPGDFRDLAAKIKVLHDHPAEALRMGENAQQWTRDRFTRERFAGEVLSVLNKVITPGS